MAMHRRHGRKAESEWLGAADRLFDEFPEVPLDVVVQALNAARREPGESPSPGVVVVRARELLREAGHQACLV